MPLRAPHSAPFQLTGSVLGSGSSGVFSKRFGPHAEGPLPAEIVGTSRGGSFSQFALESDSVLYRVCGGSSGELGLYWSRIAPSGPMQAHMGLALPRGNMAQNVVQIRVPQGTMLFERRGAALRPVGRRH